MTFPILFQWSFLNLLQILMDRLWEEGSLTIMDRQKLPENFHILRKNDLNFAFNKK